MKPHDGFLYGWTPNSAPSSEAIQEHRPVPICLFYPDQVIRDVIGVVWGYLQGAEAIRHQKPGLLTGTGWCASLMWAGASDVQMRLIALWRTLEQRRQTQLR